MRVNKLIATGTAIAAFTTAGCGAERPIHGANIKHVGQDTWVKLAQPGHNENSSFKAGEECVVVREAELILRKGGVYYEHQPEPAIGYDNPAGTECPNGAKLALSKAKVAMHDAEYQSFIARRTIVTDQVRGMGKAQSGPVRPGERWVDIVNPEPIGGANVTRKYGDTCNTARATATKIGKLSTGETVMSIINPGAAGSACPTGSEYLVEPHGDAAPVYQDAVRLV